MIRQIPFVKYHGMGNDWIVAMAEQLPSNLPALALNILDRHTGVGADGFIAVMSPRVRSNDARVRFFNADGSEAEMSGNGIRCAGAFLVERHPRCRSLNIETLAGLKTLEKRRAAAGEWVFRVRMGKPTFTAAQIPFRPEETASPLLRFPLRTQCGELPVTITSMGNPHCSVFVADFEAVDWLGLGREIERSEHFPNRTNVEFVRLLSKNEIAVRFWERGVGHTMSSGTGSCAAVVAAILNGLTDRRVRVQTEAGTLEIAWPADGEVTMVGPVVRVMAGKFNYAVRHGR